MADHVSKTIDTYNSFAKAWVEVANDSAISRWISESIEQFAHVLPDNRVLVPGCGDGRDAQALCELGLTVDAFDLSSAMLKIAQDLQHAEPPHPSIRLWQMDMRELHTLQTRYGGIFASGCLYHLNPQEFTQFIGNAAHRLVDNGVFYLNMKLGQGQELRPVPKDNYPGGKIAQQRLAGDRYYAYYSMEELLQLLSPHFTLISKRMMEPHTEAVLELLLRKSTDQANSQ